MIIEAVKMYNKLANEGEPIFAQSGPFDDIVLEKLFEEVEERIENFENNFKRKVFFITVELIQNVFHHAEKHHEIDVHNNYFHYLIIKISNSLYKISCGNFINNRKKNNLVSRIEQLNMLTDEEVKHLYKNVLNMEEFSEKGGGGLGMIDIRRKSGENLEYEIINFNKNLYFFNFSIFLKNKF